MDGWIPDEIEQVALGEAQGELPATIALPDGTSAVVEPLVVDGRLVGVRWAPEAPAPRRAAERGLGRPDLARGGTRLWCAGDRVISTWGWRNEWHAASVTARTALGPERVYHLRFPAPEPPADPDVREALVLVPGEGEVLAEARAPIAPGLELWCRATTGGPQLGLVTAGGALPLLAPVTRECEVLGERWVVQLLPPGEGPGSVRGLLLPVPSEADAERACH